MIFAGKPAPATLLAAGLIGLGHAQDIPSRAGTAEFQYLGILVFARPAGLAGAYTSLAQAEDAVGYNPAGLAKLGSKRSFSGTLRYHFAEVQSGNVTYAFPGERGGNYAFSVAYVNYGHIDEMDENGNATGKEVAPASFNPSLSFARRLSDKAVLGGTGKVLTEYLGDFEGSEMAWGWGADLGLLLQPSARNLGFGLTLLNLGRKEGTHFTGDEDGGPLPVSLKGGLFYYPLDLPKGRLALDVELPWHDSPLLSGGIEYTYSPNLMLRAGSRLSLAEAEELLRHASGDASGSFLPGNALKAAGGFTFQVEGIAVDYAAQYWLGLSWVHALTVRYAVL